MPRSSRRLFLLGFAVLLAVDGWVAGVSAASSATAVDLVDAWLLERAWDADGPFALAWRAQGGRRPRIFERSTGAPSIFWYAALCGLVRARFTAAVNCVLIFSS